MLWRDDQIWPGLCVSVNIKSSRADQVQSVSMGVGGETDMLNEVKNAYNVQDIRGGFRGGRLEMEIEVTYCTSNMVNKVVQS